jgi:hypothetical protein
LRRFNRPGHVSTVCRVAVQAFQTIKQDSCALGVYVVVGRHHDLSVKFELRLSQRQYECQSATVEFKWLIGFDRQAKKTSCLLGQVRKRQHDQSQILPGTAVLMRCVAAPGLPKRGSFLDGSAKQTQTAHDERLSQAKSFASNKTVAHHERFWVCSAFWPKPRINVRFPGVDLLREKELLVFARLASLNAGPGRLSACPTKNIEISDCSSEANLLLRAA